MLFFPSEIAVRDAIMFIRRTVPHAGSDNWPVDCAAPTSLIIGISLREEIPIGSWSTLASMAGISRADALEWGELCELAAESGKWVDWRWVLKVRDILSGASTRAIPATDSKAGISI